MSELTKKYLGERTAVITAYSSWCVANGRSYVLNEGWEDFVTGYISASQAREAELREKLESSKQEIDRLKAVDRRTADALRDVSQKLEAAEAALKPQPLPEGLVPHAYQLEAVIRNADFWYKAGHNEPNTGKAVMNMAQAMFAWKNAALAKAEEVMNLQQRISESQEQEPFSHVYRGSEPVPLFLHPITPPSHEQYYQLKCENAELTHKLAAQQAILVNISNGLQELQSAEYGEDADEAARSMQRLIATTDGEELTRLLAEARKVPEEVLVEIVMNAHMAGQFSQSQRDSSYYEARVYYGEKQIEILEKLASAPQPPKEDKA